MAPRHPEVLQQLQPYMLPPNRWSSQKKDKQHMIETQKNGKLI